MPDVTTVPSPDRPLATADRVILCDQETKQANERLTRILVLCVQARAADAQSYAAIAGEQLQDEGRESHVVLSLRAALKEARRLQVDLERALEHAEQLATARPREMAVRA